MQVKRFFPPINPKKAALSLLGSAILAFGLYQIHSFSGISEGGILGINLLMEHWFSISPALTNFVLTAICYFVGWRFLGKEFVLYSIFSGGGFSLFYAIFERMPPMFPRITASPLLSALAGAVFVGVGVGFCVGAGGAPGGDDALAMALSHLTGWRIQRWYLISDLAVLAVSLTYIPISKILYSLLTVVLSGQILGWVAERWKRHLEK